MAGTQHIQETTTKRQQTIDARFSVCLPTNVGLLVVFLLTVIILLDDQQQTTEHRLYGSKC